jgi:hypothetical protein
MNTSTSSILLFNNTILLWHITCSHLMCYTIVVTIIFTSFDLYSPPSFIQIVLSLQDQAMRNLLKLQQKL